MKRIKRLSGAAATVAVLLGATAAGVAAQEYKPFSINVRGGIGLPTGSISDVAKVGPAVGFGIGYNLGRVELRGNADFGFHKVKGDANDLDIDVFHYIGSAGYHLIDPRGDSPVRVLVNLGAGAVNFKVGDDGDSQTFFAINAGAELGYEVSRSFEMFLNLQGDIAFKSGDDMDLGTSNSTAWVWPLTAGLKLRI